MPMLHLAGSVVCPYCSHRFAVCVHVDELPPPDTVYTVSCPRNASRLRVAAGDLRQAVTCPAGAVAPYKAGVLSAQGQPMQPPARRWWPFRSWFGGKGSR
jgi:hypothetical protein